MTVLEKLVQDIKEAIIEAERDGWTIIPRITIHQERRQCCALGALIATKKIEKNGNVFSDVAQRYQIPQGALSDFADGFDSIFNKKAKYIDYYEAGISLRNLPRSI